MKLKFFACIFIYLFCYFKVRVLNTESRKYQMGFQTSCIIESHQQNMKFLDASLHWILAVFKIFPTLMDEKWSLVILSLNIPNDQQDCSCFHIFKVVRSFCLILGIQTITDFILLGLRFLCMWCTYWLGFMFLLME